MLFDKMKNNGKDSMNTSLIIKNILLSLIFVLVPTTTRKCEYLLQEHICISLRGQLFESLIICRLICESKRRLMAARLDLLTIVFGINQSSLIFCL